MAKEGFITMDCSDLIRAVNTLRRRAKAQGPKRAATAIIGADYVTVLKTSIELESIPMVPLSPSWIDYKYRNDFDSRKMIATGDYMKSISLKMVGSTAVIVGDVEKAICHEYGFPPDKIPARPHWRPVYSMIANNEYLKARALQAYVNKVFSGK